MELVNEVLELDLGKLKSIKKGNEDEGIFFNYEDGRVFELLTEEEAEQRGRISIKEYLYVQNEVDLAYFTEVSHEHIKFMMESMSEKYAEMLNDILFVLVKDRFNEYCTRLFVVNGVDAYLNSEEVHQIDGDHFLRLVE